MQLGKHKYKSIKRAITMLVIIVMLFNFVPNVVYGIQILTEEKKVLEDNIVLDEESTNEFEKEASIIRRN